MDILQILFFAGLAVFLAVRLYLALGKPTGRTPEEHAREQREKAAAMERAAPAPAPIAEPEAAPVASAFTGPAGEGLAAIAAVDASFDPKTFLSGAKSAYGLIVEAFAAGDRDALRPLLSDRVMAAYDSAIAARETAGQVIKTEIERLKRAEISEASLNGDKAKVKVAFAAELASETRDAEGQLVDGDLATLKTVEEIWSFERDVTSENPNWRLGAVKPA